MSHAVLVIEDEAVLAKNILIYLKRYGYEVHLAQSAEGLGLLDSVHADAVLLDLNCPASTVWRHWRAFMRSIPASTC